MPDLLQVARERLARALSAPRWGHALADAVRDLFAADHAALMDWRGPTGDEAVIFGSTARDAQGRPVVPEYFLKGWVRRFRQYRLDKPDHLANRVLRFEDAVRGYPRKIAVVFFKTMMIPHGLEHFVRCPMYLGDRFVAFVGAVRRRGAPPFSDDELARAEALVPLLAQSIASRRALDQEHLDPGNLMGLAEAMTEPAFVVTRDGVVIYANNAARLAYPRLPGWIADCCLAESDQSCPPWVRCVPLKLPSRSLYLLLPETLHLDPNDAGHAPWAMHWNLPPRHARVAAWLMHGLSDQETAEKTGLSLSTVRTYVREVLRGAGVHSRAELVRAAVEVKRR